MNRQMAIGITHSKHSFDLILNYFIKMNPTFPVSLIAIKDRFDTPIPESCERRFDETWIIRKADDIFAFADTEAHRSKLRELLPYMHNNSLWKNLAILVALLKQFETLVLWDDDQYPITLESTADWCQPIYESLRSGYDVVEVRRYGALHPIPFNISEYVSGDVLSVLESVLGLCYEAATPNLLTKATEVFLPYPGVTQEYEMSDQFHSLRHISGGSIGLNLKSHFPLFYQPPGKISRGNDVFFSCAFRSMKKRMLVNSYLHDGQVIYGWDPMRDWKTVIPTPSTKEAATKTFFRVIEGWLSYAPLLLRLEFPQTFQDKISMIRHQLQRLDDPYHVFYLHFEKYSQRLNTDLEGYDRANELWRQLLLEIQQGS
jgi:hypothetical protein